MDPFQIMKVQINFSRIHSKMYQYMFNLITNQCGIGWKETKGKLYEYVDDGFFFFFTDQ